jgi:hypothetical protein
MFGHDAISEAYIMSDEYKKKLKDAEEVYDKYTDTAGNLHWTGTHSGKHIIRGALPKLRRKNEKALVNKKMIC